MGGRQRTSLFLTTEEEAKKLGLEGGKGEEEKGGRAKKKA